MHSSTRHALECIVLGGAVQQVIMRHESVVETSDVEAGDSGTSESKILLFLED